KYVQITRSNPTTELFTALVTSKVPFSTRCMWSKGLSCSERNRRRLCSMCKYLNTWRKEIIYKINLMRKYGYQLTRDDMALAVQNKIAFSNAQDLSYLI